MGLPTMVRLTPGHWIRLPGTDIEVYLMGKFRDRASNVICVHGHPTTLAEAVRPLIRRRPDS